MRRKRFTMLAQIVAIILATAVAASAANGSVQPDAGNVPQYFAGCVGLADEGWPNLLMSSWFSSVLEAMKEPSLCGKDGSEIEQYRFVWLRSFDDAVAVRAARESEGPVLHVRILRGFQILAIDETGAVVEYDPGRLIRTEDRSLEQQEWLAFTKQVRVSGFWDSRSFDDPGGVDGAEWLMEGVRDGQYHAVTRWSPKDGPFRELCLGMLKLAGGDFGPIY